MRDKAASGDLVGAILDQMCSCNPYWIPPMSEETDARSATLQGVQSWDLPLRFKEPPNYDVLAKINEILDGAKK